MLIEFGLTLPIMGYSSYIYVATTAEGGSSDKGGKCAVARATLAWPWPWARPCLAMWIKALPWGNKITADL